MHDQRTRSVLPGESLLFTRVGSFLDQLYKMVYWFRPALQLVYWRKFVNLK